MPGIAQCLWAQPRGTSPASWTQPQDFPANPKWRPRLHEAWTQRQRFSIADQDTVGVAALLPRPNTVNDSHLIAPSPASTESLIRRTFLWLLLTPLNDPLDNLEAWDNGAHNYPLTPTDFPSMMSAFYKMLYRGHPKLLLRSLPQFMLTCSTWA